MKPGTLDRLARGMGVRVPLPNDSGYGINHARITAVLNEHNWRDKARACMALTGPVYVYLSYSYKDPEEGSPRIYLVVVVLYDDRGAGQGKYIEKFESLAEALEYANGSRAGALKLLTRPATPEEYPLQRGPRLFVTPAASKRWP